MRASANAAPPSSAREAGDFVDVRGGVALHAIGIGVPRRVNLIAGDQLAIGAGDAEMSRDRLQAVSGKFARREIVAEDGVHRVDQLAARRDESHAAGRIVLRAHAAPRGALTQAGRARCGPSASGTPRRRARRSRNGRSKPCRL